MIGRHLSKSVFCSLSILMCSSLYGADLGESAYDADILNTKQLGHVRHIIDSARQLPGDWRYMEPRTPLSFDAYQFQLAFMSYALAVVQMNYTPAYKELYKDAQLRLIEKIVRRDVWAPTWVEVVEMPYYSKYLEAGKEWRDPVREKNIMYSGHLLQMIGLYEVLYHDLRFDKPDSIVFELPGLDGFKNTYNHHSLAQLIMISLWRVITWVLNVNPMTFMQSVISIPYLALFTMIGSMRVCFQMCVRPFGTRLKN